MRNGYRFIDSDAHVIEPADMFAKYLEPQFRSPMPVAWANYQGEPLAFSFKLVIPAPRGGEYVMPFGRDPLDAAALARTGGASFDAGTPVALPGHDEAYADFARQGFPPEMYKLAMERTGIDYMVVYPSAGLLTTAVPELAADTAAAYRRAYNNWLHDFCSGTDGRVFGAASVDLRDAEEAAREARRCVKEFNFKAVHINPVPVCEHRLYDDFYEPLWKALEDLDVPLAIHTGTGTAADEMLYYYLPRLRTAQTTVAFTIGNILACTALIMGGVLERHPKLRVVHLESGAGWVAFWLDRLAASVQGGFRGLEIPGLKLHPIDYFQRQCYISADPDDPGIKQVIDVMGDDNLVTATDFSHPEGRRYAWAVKEMLELPGVSAESKRKIMWDNALRLYPIQAD
ncbi:MAG TPA: amidohydrolase family protein [Candidatus Binatia bacterium]|jgi:predicted TIM-barrel fold metal-dependent hydrolase|nr:amidohydrolase family protein [Candidatus Binatia bacterium]